MHETIDSILAGSPGAISDAADSWFTCALAERDPTAAERALVALGDSPCWGYSAVIAAWAGEKDTALQYLEANGKSSGGSVVGSYSALKLLPFWDPLWSSKNRGNFGNLQHQSESSSWVITKTGVPARLAPRLIPRPPPTPVPVGARLRRIDASLTIQASLVVVSGR